MGIFSSCLSALDSRQIPVMLGEDLLRYLMSLRDLVLGSLFHPSAANNTACIMPSLPLNSGLLRSGPLNEMQIAQVWSTKRNANCSSLVPWTKCRQFWALLLRLRYLRAILTAKCHKNEETSAIFPFFPGYSPSPRGWEGRMCLVAATPPLYFFQYCRKILHLLDELELQLVCYYQGNAKQPLHSKRCGPYFFQFMTFKQVQYKHVPVSWRAREDEFVNGCPVLWSGTVW